MYNIVVVIVCFRIFYQIIFVCKLLKFYLNYTELYYSLFNVGNVLIVINSTVKL